MYEDSERPSRPSYGPGTSSRWRILDISPLPQPTEVTGTLVPLPSTEPPPVGAPPLRPGIVRANRLWSELDTLLAQPPTPTPTTPTPVVRPSKPEVVPVPPEPAAMPLVAPHRRPGWQMALIVVAIAFCVLVVGTLAVAALAVYAPAGMLPWLQSLRHALLSTGLF